MISDTRKRAILEKLAAPWGKKMPSAADTGPLVGITGGAAKGSVLSGSAAKAYQKVNPSVPKQRGSGNAALAGMKGPATMGGGAFKRRF